MTLALSLTPFCPATRILPATTRSAPAVENPTITRYFDTTAFVGQTINTIGDQIVARNLLHGPSLKRVDMSVFKDVPLSGTARLQLRMEIHNLTNTPSFGTERSARERRVRHDHQHARHAAADAVRGEIPLLKRFA